MSVVRCVSPDWRCGCISVAEHGSLLGTDVYPRYEPTPASAAALAAADAIVALQPLAASALPAALRAKARTIVQSATAIAPAAPAAAPRPAGAPRPFVACVLAHLRPVKDPLLPVRALAPGHGHVIETPQDEVRRLIAHRLKREDKVRAALARVGPATLEVLVTHAYDDVPSRIHNVAMRSLHASLIRLEKNGVALCADGRWRVAEP